MSNLTSPFYAVYLFLEAKIQEKRETGAVAIEYALLATFIAVAIIAAVTGVGTKLISVFGNVVTKLG
jgi:pilus assembly protein Flp/PilA